MSPGVGPGAALSALAIGGGSEAVVRGELSEATFGIRKFLALRKLRWGTPILTERPLLLLEPDTDRYLKAEDADPRFAELAQALGDSTRLAAYVAFRQLHERKQKELLALWHEDLESRDPVAKAIYEANQKGIESFLEDHPQFRQSIYWNHVILVSSIFGRFGLVNSDGSKAVYSICSHIRHSCTPNAAWFTLRKGFPRGKRMLHVIHLDGIQRREEITVSHLEEVSLLQPQIRRSLSLVKNSGIRCQCSRCEANDEEADERSRDGKNSGGEAFSEWMSYILHTLMINHDNWIRLIHVLPNCGFEQPVSESVAGFDFLEHAVVRSVGHELTGSATCLPKCPPIWPRSRQQTALLLRHKSACLSWIDCCHSPCKPKPKPRYS